MKDLCRKFHRIFLVELEDLKEDLDLFIKVMETRHNSGEITDYVYNENLAVLRNELLGIQDCARGCADIESTGKEAIEEISAVFKLRLRERLREHGYVPALYALLEKRVDKIAAYLKKESIENAGGSSEATLGSGLDTAVAVGRLSAGRPHP